MNHIVKKFFLLSFLLCYNSIAAQADYKTEIDIKKKYDYFKNDISSAEDFIRLSATKSTMSGSKYYIKCAGSPKMESGVWLLQELEKYRKKESK
jgi:hypothetical protein